MDVAALIAWILTAGGGFYLLGTWLARGGMRQQQTGETRFPAPLIFGHFVLAAIGLVLWIVYLGADSAGLAWTAFAVLVVVALLGTLMVVRWSQDRQAGGRQPATRRPAEQNFPLPVVVGHGIFAAATIVLVLIAAAR